MRGKDGASGKLSRPLRSISAALARIDEPVTRDVTITLGLRYDTTPDQMRWVLAEIRKLFLAHEKVEPEPGRVRFTHYGAFSLDLDIFC